MNSVASANTAEAPPAVDFAAYHDFIDQAKRRDTLIFRLGFVALIVVFGASSLALYRGLEAMDGKLAAYSDDIGKAKREMEQLGGQLTAQAKSVEFAQEKIDDMKDADITKLMNYSANFRSDINKLNATVKQQQEAIEKLEAKIAKQAATINCLRNPKHPGHCA